MRKPSIIARLVAVGVTAWSTAWAQATVVGVEGFDYADGTPIANQTGGTGWDYLRTSESAPNPGMSDWDNVTGAPSVSAGRLVTNGSAAKREYRGMGEGVTMPSSEREGAFRGTGVVYYGFDLTPSFSSPVWSGASSYDFGGERAFFGITGNASGFFGISESGVGETLSATAAVSGTTYRLVAAVDFDADQLKLWINPDGVDFDAGASNSADVVRPYTGSNWSTAVRLASGAGNTAAYDNLVVATTFAEAAVPEPSAAAAALAAGGLWVLRRRRA